MDNLEKIKRHLGRPVPITLKNEEGIEDIFYFKKLNIEQQALLFHLSRRMSSRPKIKVEDKEIPDISKEDMKEMFELILDVVKNSFEGIDEKTAIDFADTNFNELSEKLQLLIPEQSSREDIALAKKKAEEIRNAAKSEQK